MLVMTMSSMRDWVSLLAAIGNLSLAVIPLSSGRRSPLARPIAALCFVLFGWNFSVLAHHLRLRAGGASEDAFTVLDAFFTTLSPPLVLEVVLAFVGESRRRRGPRGIVWAIFGSLALASLAGLASEAVFEWHDSASWSLLFLAGYVPTLVWRCCFSGDIYAGAATVARKRGRGSSSPPSRLAVRSP